MKPILFNTEMVRAILTGRKTCTRRVIKAPGLYADPNDPPTHIREWGGGAFSFQWNNRGMNSGHIVLRPPYQVGDCLYVRETWALAAGKNESKHVIYKADGFMSIDSVLADAESRWRPSIHMPKKAARLFLHVKSVRVERLQDMTEDGAYEEGYSGIAWCYHEVWENYPDSPIPCDAASNPGCPADPPCNHSIPELFGSEIWDKTIKPADRDRYSWNANPWVWVIEFERCEKQEEENK